MDECLPRDGRETRRVMKYQDGGVTTSARGISDGTNIVFGVWKWYAREKSSHISLFPDYAELTRKLRIEEDCKEVQKDVNEWRRHGRWNLMYKNSVVEMENSKERPSRRRPVWIHSHPWTFMILVLQELPPEGTYSALKLHGLLPWGNYSQITYHT